MQTQAINFAIERQRHRGFVGRAALLAQIDQLLVEERADRWVVVTGGPGMGKSALLSAWLARREAAGDPLPHHFIRRGWADWDDPARLVGSLIVQIEARFPNLPEPETDAHLSPAARLAATLGRVSECALVPRAERLIILIDGLDEYDPPPGPPPSDPIGAFLPYALPPGISFLCASRPRHPYVDALATRGVLVQLDLDDAQRFTADNEATVHAFWEQAAPALGLDASFIEDAVRRADGNLQHAATLRQHLAGSSPGLRRIEDIPRGLAALLASLWERIATDPAVVDGLGILCAAREGLSLDELGTVAGWAGEAQRRTFVRAARELLIEIRRMDAVPSYRLHHDSIRAHVAGAIGTAALQRHHHALAQRLATWPVPDGSCHYALAYALVHRAEAGEWEDAWRIASDMSFIETKCRELGAHEAETDVARMAERCRASGDDLFRERFTDLARALGRESHWLRAAPEATAALVWNQLRRSGWSREHLEQRLRLPAGAAFLHLRHVARRESPAFERDLVGHVSWVTACAVTPDGRHVVSASWDGTLKVWDLASGDTVTTIEGHADGLNACAITPDGRHVVSASKDRTLKVWDLASGQPVVTLHGHTSWVTACCVTPDGSHVVSASADKTLKVWELVSGRLIVTLNGHTSWVTACGVTPNGRHVVSASADKTLKVWDLALGRSVATLRGHAGWAHACAVTPDGGRVVSASADKTLVVWDLALAQPIATLHGHVDSVHACAVTSDGQRAVSASWDGTLKVWDLESGQSVATLKGHGVRVTACAVTPDGRRVVSAAGDKMLKVWDLASEHPVPIPQGHSDCVRACMVTPDGERVVSASDDETLKVWDLASGRPVATLQGHTDWVRACAVTPDGRCVVSASDDRTLKIWDLASGQPIATLQGHADFVRACVVTRDGRRVVSASDDRTLKIWDFASGQLVTTLEGHASWVHACAVTPDGRRMVSASADQTLKIWDLPSGELVATLQGHTNAVIGCVVTPDGRRVVSASVDQTLKVWDLASGQSVATLKGHTDGVLACAVDPDGRRIVSASADHTLRVWDLASHACLFTHRANTAYVAVAATMTTIIAGDAAGSVWFLDLPSSNRNERPRRDQNTGNQQASGLNAEPSLHRLSTNHTILFLAANPYGTDRLALDREARAIQMELERSGFRDSFELVTRWAAEPLDLLRELRKLKPTVVHFSGHGAPDLTGAPGLRPASHRNLVAEPSSPGGEPQSGLFFQGPDGRPQLVSTTALRQTFGAAGSSVKLVVLNACYSETQATALLAHVDCVVGMHGSIRDAAARSFTIGFYGGLGECESVAAAYQQGCAAISLEGQADSDRPQLKVRSGVDAARLILAATPATSPGESPATATPASRSTPIPGPPSRGA